MFTIFFRIFYGYRVTGRHNLPKKGAVLLVSNHQSYFDPVLIASRIRRPIRFAAMAQLFKIKILSFAMRIFGTICIDRDNPDKSAYKEILKRLKRDEAVTIFPEGTRTRDGNIQPLKPGFVRLALRSGACILPVVITGAYEVWPRQCTLPRLKGLVVVKFYPPILLSDLHDDKSRSELRKIEEEVSEKTTRILKRRIAAWQRFKNLHRHSGHSA